MPVDTPNETLIKTADRLKTLIEFGTHFNYEPKFFIITQKLQGLDSL
ncbi:hypothetical protein ZORO111903_13140 [Zobellia roscoffensis]